MNKYQISLTEKELKTLQIMSSVFLKLIKDGAVNESHMVSSSKIYIETARILHALSFKKENSNE